MTGNFPSMKNVLVIATAALLTVVFVRDSAADDAIVLPKGVSRVWGEYLDSFPITKKFNNSGEVVDVAQDYNVKLDSSTIGSLAQLEAVFKGAGLVPSSYTASFGRSDVSFKYDISQFRFQFAYGVTDKLTLGFFVPYWWVTNHVNAQLDNTGSTLVKNPAFNPTSPNPLNRLPFLPAGSPGGVPVTTEDIQNLIQTAYGYNKVQSWSGQGVGDIEIGGRYQYLKTPDWRLAFMLGIRFPTGRTDDPDDLTDYAWGTGATAFLFRLNNDYTGVKNLLLNATLRYDAHLSEQQTMRVPDYPHQGLIPLANKENVDRRPGNITEVELAATYYFTPEISFQGVYRYFHKEKDQINGSRGLNYSALETDTNMVEQIGFAYLYYSTVPKYTEKKSTVPLDVYVGYRDRFAGKNTLKSEYLICGVKLYF